MRPSAGPIRRGMFQKRVLVEGGKGAFQRLKGTLSLVAGEAAPGYIVAQFESSRSLPLS